MATKKRLSQEELDEFQEFLVEMDDVLDPFIESATQAGYKLDYSLDSLGELERLYLDRHAQEDEQLLLNRCARYLGELFRLTVGGRWQLCTTPRGVYFKLPIIADYSDRGLEYCPIEIMRTLALRKNPGFLRRTVEGDLQYARKPNN